MKKIPKEILSGCVIVMMISFILVPYFASADGQIIKLDNPFKSTSIVDLLSIIINDILMPIGGVVAVLMIMYAGFQYVTAQGNPGKITKATDALRWAAIGAAILLGAWTISRAIQGTIKDLGAPGI